MSTITLQTSSFEQLRLNLEDTLLNNLQFQYRGEGNCNLVLHLPNIKFVFRLRKTHINDIIDDQWEKEKLRLSFLYYYFFIEPYFLSTYLTIPMLAEISTTAVKLLDEKLYKERPDFRKDKHLSFGGIEIHPDYAFMPTYKKFLQYNSPPMKELDSSKEISLNYQSFRNYVYSLLSNNSPTECIVLNEEKSTNFCIEIKPKQACTAELYRKFEVCAFCMNQFLKLNEQKIKTKTQYCPLDLFSGDGNRMKKAIKGLLQMPQNNLKIFKNGEPVLMENFSNNLNRILCDWFNDITEIDNEWCTEHFCQLLVKCLTKDSTDTRRPVVFKTEPFSRKRERKIISDEYKTLITDALSRSKLSCSREFSNLPKNCILSRIKELQSLDEAGLEIVFDFYEINAKKYSHDYAYVNELILRTKCKSGDVEMPTLNALEAYLFSTAAKDLSIMITIKRVFGDSQSSDSIVNVDEYQYEVNISVVDVGPKPISSVTKHWKRDKKVFTSCLNYFYPNMNLKDC